MFTIVIIFICSFAYCNGHMNQPFQQNQGIQHHHVQQPIQQAQQPVMQQQQQLTQQQQIHQQQMQQQQIQQQQMQPQQGIQQQQQFQQEQPQQYVQQQGGNQVQQQPQQGHGHGHNHELPSDPKQAAAHFKEHARDREHAKEHLEGVIDKDPTEMTEEELQMFYFKQHDTNNDNMLDGLELVHAMTHFNPPGVNEAPRTIPEDELVVMIDAILSADDKNKDGFIEYAEFAKSQLK